MLWRQSSSFSTTRTNTFVSDVLLRHVCYALIVQFGAFSHSQRCNCSSIWTATPVVWSDYCFCAAIVLLEQYLRHECFIVLVQTHYLLFLIRNWHSQHNNMQLTPITQQYATFFHNTTICNGTHSTQQYPSTYSIVVSCCSRKCSASLCYATNISHYPWTQYTQTQQSYVLITRIVIMVFPLAYGTNAAVSNWAALCRCFTFTMPVTV